MENRIIALFNWFADSIGAPPAARKIREED
jgi:hypothetical protein